MLQDPGTHDATAAVADDDRLTGRDGHLFFDVFADVDSGAADLDTIEALYASADGKLKMQNVGAALRRDEQRCLHML